MTDISLPAAAAAMGSSPPSAPGAAASSDRPATQGSLGRLPAVMIWLPLAAVALGAASLWHFVSFAFISNPILNGLILGVALWGAATTIGHVRRAYREDRVFAAGLEWLRRGAWGQEPHPQFGHEAFVQGMLARLEKLGLGHQVHMQSAVAEPEIEALEQYFEKKQELSQFLVGLMVGLGLLGTFVGLLETLIATSQLISTIANSVGGSSGGGGMESEFARIVGGLQKPLEAMGTAFSASMFGLIGSIMLGFQMVIVRKTCAQLVDNIREEVLALAEKTNVSATVEISERFLANLLADVLEQHRQSREDLGGVAQQLGELMRHVSAATTVNTRLAEELQAHGKAVDAVTGSIGHFKDAVPLVRDVATYTGLTLKTVEQHAQSIGGLSKSLPALSSMREELQATRQAVDRLGEQVAALSASHQAVVGNVQTQANSIRRLDALLWNEERQSFRKILESDPPGGRHG